MKTLVLMLCVLCSVICKGQFAHESGLVSAPYINYLQDFDTLDFNNDGRIDFIVAGGFDDDLVLLINNGDDNFKRQRLFVYPESVFVESICSIDINNDEFMDIAVYKWTCFFNPFSGCMQDERTIDFFTNINGENVQLVNSVLLEETNLNFPYDFIKRDVNSDGKLDLIISRSNYAFLTSEDLTLNISEPTVTNDLPRFDKRIQYFDFNNNNDNEIVYVAYVNNLQHLIVKDSETVDTLFAEPYSVLRPILSTHIMDYDFDGNADLFINVRDSIIVFTHSELGWSTEFQTVYVNTTGENSMNYLTSFSLPNDSANFFIVQTDTFPRVISQNNEGTFVNHSIIYNPFKSEMISEKYIIDTHENDSTYIIYAESYVYSSFGIVSESIITSFIGRKEENSVEYYRNILGDQHDLILFTHDINGDGLEDLVCRKSYYLQDSVSSETGLSYFAPAEPIFRTYDENNLKLDCYGVADVNGDGKQDFLLSSINNHYASQSIVCKTYNEEESQSNLFNLSLGTLSDYAYRRILEVDLDNDSINELIVASYNTSFTPNPIDTNFVVLKRQGNEYLPFYYGSEAFENFSVVNFNITTFNLYYSMVISDINNDSFKDIVFIGSQNGILSFIAYINNSDGSFLSPQIIQFESEIFSISSFEISDVNADGIMDILISQNNSIGQGFLRVKYGMGNLEFSEPEILIFNENARIEDFATVDIDQDGELEILLSAFTSQATFDDSLNHGLKLFKRQFNEFTEAYTFAQSNPPRIFVLSQAATELNKLKIYTNDATHKTVFGQIYELRSEVSQHVLTKRDIVTKSHLESLNLENDLIIYPNPGLSEFTVNTKSIGENKYFIFTTSGQLVGQGKLYNSKSFDVDLPDGMYIIQVNGKHALFSVIH